MSVHPSVGPSVSLSVRSSVRNEFFSIGQKWVETNKNEISDDEAGRDYTSHDSIRGCVRPSVRGSVGPSVRPSVRHAFFLCPNLRENELVTEKEYREGEASRD